MGKTRTIKELLRTKSLIAREAIRVSKEEGQMLFELGAMVSEEIVNDVKFGELWCIKRIYKFRGKKFSYQEDKPGSPLHPAYRNTTHNLEEYLRTEGTGQNLLRIPKAAQPRALKVGDILATGDRVLSEPREGGNGSVLIHLTGGTDGHWIDVPARIPIAIRSND